MTSTIYERDLSTLYSYFHLPSPEYATPTLEDISRALPIMLWAQIRGYRVVPMLSDNGQVGLYYDSDDTYIDFEFETNKMVSIYGRDRKTGEEMYEECSDKALISRVSVEFLYK